MNFYIRITYIVSAQYLLVIITSFGISLLLLGNCDK